MSKMGEVAIQADTKQYERAIRDLTSALKTARGLLECGNEPTDAERKQIDNAILDGENMA